MAEYQPKDLSGALFKNDKGDNPNRPDYRGDCLINGEKFWISAWIKTPRQGGDKFMSLSLQPADEQQRGAPRQQQRQPAGAGYGGGQSMKQRVAQRPPVEPPFEEGRQIDIDDCPF